MIASTLEDLTSFALLAPAFGGEWLLARSLVPAPDGALCFLPYEADASGLQRYSAHFEPIAEPVFDAPAPTLFPELDASQHAAGVESIRSAIAAGDVYQVNLTLRARVHLDSAAALAAKLCARAVPRFFAWVRLPSGLEIVSASPELFFAIDDRLIRTEPMKGTAAPSAAGQLDTSEKDRAELAMITDLLRNDLTPICRPGSVRVVNERRFIELPYAIQAVSDVEGELLPDATLPDVLGALHPGGSVTGAPKGMACEKIRELEPQPRGPYCGTLGFSRAGRSVFSLLIRTAWREVGSSVWTYGVGGGIVWDSNAESELAEVSVKLGALR